MPKKTILFTLLVALLLLAVSPAAAQNDETLTIAFIGADSSDPAYRAAVIAAEEINAQDGDEELAGPDGTVYTLEIAFYAASTDDEAVDAYNDILDDDAIAILGPTTASGVEAILDDVTTPAIPMLYASPDAPTTSNAYRLIADYDTRAMTIADYLVNRRQFTQIAIAVADTETAQSARSAFITAAETGGATIVTDLTHPADATNLQSDAAKIDDSDAEALFLWTLDQQAFELMRGLQDEGWNGLVVHGEMDADFLRRADPALIDGLVGPVVWMPSAYDTDSQVFVTAYSDRWDQTPDAAAVVTYDAVYLLAKGLRASGPELTNLDTLPAYDGVAGVYSAVKTNDLMMAQVYNGQMIDQVRYTQDTCANCPGFWLSDVTDSDAGVNTLTIALIAATDGPTEVTALNIEHAAELAVREINDLGGVIGPDGVYYTFTLHTYEATTPADTAQAIQQALDDGAIAILGPDSYAQIAGNLPLTGVSGVPQIVSATAPMLTRSRLNGVYQMRSADDLQAASVAAYLVDVLGYIDIATINIRADYAQTAKSAAEDVITASEDGQLILSLEYDLREADYNHLARQIAAANPQSVIVWTPTMDVQPMLDALEAAGWQGTFVYGYLTPELMVTLTIPEGIDVIGPVTWWNSAQDWRSLTFTAAYQDAYGEMPKAQGAAYYDMIYLVVQGVRQNGPGNLYTWVGDVEGFVGVQGIYNPPTTGAVMLTQSTIIAQLSNAALTELARFDGTTCLTGCEN